jgi:hypothetical protein
MVNDTAMAAGTSSRQDRSSSDAVEGPNFNMMIVGLKEHFPARISEWFNAAILASWGAYLLLHPDLFKTPGLESVYANMESLVDQPQPRIGVGIRRVLGRHGSPAGAVHQWSLGAHAAYTPCDRSDQRICVDPSGYRTFRCSQHRAGGLSLAGGD